MGEDVAGDRREKAFEILLEINTKLTTLCVTMEHNVKDGSKQDACIASVKDRLRQLEKTQAYLVGGLILLGAVMGFVAKLI